MRNDPNLCPEYTLLFNNSVAACDKEVNHKGRKHVTYELSVNNDALIKISWKSRKKRGKKK